MSETWFPAVPLICIGIAILIAVVASGFDWLRLRYIARGKSMEDTARRRARAWRVGFVSWMAAVIVTYLYAGADLSTAYDHPILILGFFGWVIKGVVITPIAGFVGGAAYQVIMDKMSRINLEST